MSLRKQKSQGNAVEVTVNSKEEICEDFCLDFVEEFGLRWNSCTVKYENIGSHKGGGVSEQGYNARLQNR